MTERSRRYRNQESDIFGDFVRILGQAFWALITLPFRGVRSKVRLDRNAYQKRWWNITELAGHKNSEQHWQQAVIEADKLVDQAMRELAFPGASFGERLRAAERRFDRSSYQNMWDAHKLRNQIAHEVGSRIDRAKANRALMAFERGLRVLGAL
ncbi:MAG: hypothetical protein AAB647_02540 [Patescibacteria group bacterium]